MSFMFSPENDLSIDTLPQGSPTRFNFAKLLLFDFIYTLKVFFMKPVELQLQKVFLCSAPERETQTEFIVFCSISLLNPTRLNK